MLELIPTTWYSAFWPQSWSGGTEGRCFFLSYDAVRPFKLGFKPRASKMNFMGNTDVDHVQFHGYAVDPDDRFSLGGKSVDGIVERLGLPYWIRFYDSKFRIRTVNMPIFQGMATLFSDPIHVQSLTTRSTYCLISGARGLVLEMTISVAYISRYRQITAAVNFRGLAFDESTRTYSEISQFEYPGSSNLFGDLSIADDPVLIRTGYSARLTRVLSNAEIPRDLSLYDSAAEYLIHSCYEALYSTYTLSTRVVPTPMPGTDRIFSAQYWLRAKRTLLLDALRWEPVFNLDQWLGDATQSAADAALKFTGNTGTLIKELFELRDTLRDLWLLLKGDVNLKNLSSLWLSARYGLKLTYQDTADLLKAISEELRHDDVDYSWSRGGVGSDPSARAKLFFDPARRGHQKSWWAQLMEWDLFPSLANVWDIIPYSFVVDWFVDVEGFLSAFDTHTYLSVMEIFSTCYTFKHSWRPQSAVWHGLIGNIWFTRFIRTCPKEPYQPIPTFSGSLPSNKNIVDGAALIIQRL